MTPTPAGRQGSGAGRPGPPRVSAAREVTTAVIKDTYPVRWTGREAVVTLPEHIDVSNATQISEQLLSLINRGAAALIPVYPCVEAAMAAAMPAAAVPTVPEHDPGPR